MALLRGRCDKGLEVCQTRPVWRDVRSLSGMGVQVKHLIKTQASLVLGTRVSRNSRRRNSTIVSRLIGQTSHRPLVTTVLLFVAVLASARSYYVTQSGSGAGDGSSLANAWSVASYNSSSAPGGGDTVYFSGTITSTVAPNTSGTGNGASRLTLDLSGASIDTASPRIRISGKNYLNVNGGTLGTATGGTLINFNGVQSHDVTIQGWTHTGSSTSTATVITGQYCYNLTIQNNTITNVAGLFFGDSILNHDIQILNNSCLSSPNTSVQTDIIKMGDAYNVTISGNKLVQRAPGATTERHNDVIQCYQKGGSNAGQPYGWVVRYNWIELDVPSGSGDTSWMMIENMQNSGGTAAIKIYSNVFVGRSGTVSNNGICPNTNASSAAFYFYNNTIVLTGSTPDNTIRFLSPGTVYAKNNVGYAVTSPGTGISWTMAEGGVWDRNYFYRLTGANSNSVGPNGSTSTDPQISNVAGDDFTLKLSSACRAAGENLGSEYSQGLALGATWPNPALVARGASWDVGAYQSSTTASQAPQPPINIRILP